MDGSIEEGIEEAYREGRLVEAFALLHGLIDWWMIALYQTHLALVENRPNWVGIIDENPSWKQSLGRFRKNKIIDDGEKTRLERFNELRNKVIHRLIIRVTKRE